MDKRTQKLLKEKDVVRISKVGPRSATPRFFPYIKRSEGKFIKHEDGELAFECWLECDLSHNKAIKLYKERYAEKYADNPKYVQDNSNISNARYTHITRRYIFSHYPDVLNDINQACKRFGRQEITPERFELMILTWLQQLTYYTHGRSLEVLPEKLYDCMRANASHFPGITAVFDKIVPSAKVFYGECPF